MKIPVMLLCGAALVSTAALADDRSNTKESGDTFKALDTDNDGKISKEEASANQHFSNTFDKLDGNSDGYITKREFQRNTMRRPKPGP
jgi:Ca2+-binding EF-hand superfamily protein